MHRPSKPITHPELSQALQHLEASLAARRIIDNAAKRDATILRGARGNERHQKKKLGKDF